MDTALKHRLTGAVILVLLAVLLLPELLSGRGQSERVGASGTGSAAGGAERSIEIDLTEAARAPLAPPADATPAAESAAPPTADAPVVLPVPPAASAPAASTPAVSAPAANTPAVNTPPAAPAPVQAAAAPEPAKAPAASAKGTYFVQIGVYVNSASARTLERKLEDKKFAVVVDEIARAGKTLHRVRVGPVVDRAAASALRTRLEQAGHKGSVVQ